MDRRCGLGMRRGTVYVCVYIRVYVCVYISGCAEELRTGAVAEACAEELYVCVHLYITMYIRKCICICMCVHMYITYM